MEKPALLEIATHVVAALMSRPDVTTPAEVARVALDTAAALVAEHDRRLARSMAATTFNAVVARTSPKTRPPL